MSKDLLRTALLLPVPEAEPVVGQWRARFDPSASHGVPPHITLIFPYLPSGRCTPAVNDELRSLFAETPAFQFKLTKVGSFPGVHYLAPDPVDLFVEIVQELVRRFPEAPPYGGAFDTIIPHLTIAHTSDQLIVQRVADEVSPYLPLVCQAQEALLMRENIDGQWQLNDRFPLART